MIFVADESVDHPIVVRLRELGHQVVAIAEVSPRSDDADVLRRSADGGAVLITGDKDFGELVFRQRLHSAGVLLLRLIDAVATAIGQHGNELKGRFAVLSSGQLRIRDQ
jgi:hypothetical protein